MTDSFSRRSFIKQTSATAAAMSLAGTLGSAAYAQGGSVIRVGLVGCGGRGTGAIANLMETKGNIKVVAVGDAFDNAAKGAADNFKKRWPTKVDLPEDRVFSGLDNYKKVIDIDQDLVVIAGPPGFRPQQFEYAVAKGRHVFMEKPVATDAPGVRRVLAAVEESKKKNLLVGVGLQRRHEIQYTDTVKRIHDGAIGDIELLRVYWNGGGIWYRGEYENDPQQLKHQCRNWFHFIWACGDQICEQHIHNIDVGCWVKGAYPVEANGMGGNGQRLDGQGTKSQIFDHTFVEYTFADGTKMYSQGRHVAGAWGNVSEFAHGSKGTAEPSRWIQPKDGERWRFQGERQGGHQQEQHDLVEALMSGKIYNEGETGAKSTLTAILGREACYSAKVVKWDDLLAKGIDYAPGIDSWTWDSTPPVVRGADGRYPVPRPGKWNPMG